VVVSRGGMFKPDGVALSASLDNALDNAERMAYEIGADEIIVIGGERIYRDTLPVAGRIYLTEVLCEADGNAYFPELDENQWSETARENSQRGDGDDYDYNFVTLDKKS
jgi:dihydrofolate reductase